MAGTVAIRPGAIVATGKISATTDAAQVAATQTECSSVLIVADEDNTAPIWIGKSDVAAENGVPLYAGRSISLPVADLQTVYVIAESAQSAYYLATRE